MAAKWWQDHENLAMVAKRISDQGNTVEEIIYMLEKPWKFDAEFIAAAKEG